MLFRSKKPEVDVKELKTLLESDQDIILIDVRQPQEHNAGNIGGQLIPLNTLGVRLDDIADLKEKTFYVYCRSGGRSGQAVGFLQKNGFKGATNVKGGMLAWQAHIDPSLTV